MGYDSINVYQANEAKLAFEHAQRLTTPAKPPEGVSGNPIILVPKDWKAEKVPGWEPNNPHRTKADVRLSTVESFSRYVIDYKEPSTRIFAEIGNEGGKFTAIIDYHDTEGGPGWCQHQAIYTPAHSEPWKRWTGINRKKLTQAEFAQFLEDNLDTVREPAGADLLQIINTIEIDGTTEFRSAQRLSDGSVRFVYQNDQRAKSGEMSVPTEFLLRLPIFDEEPCSDVRARLRYRLAAGEFHLWFELVNPHFAVRDALGVILERIAKGTAITPLRGTFTSTYAT